MGGAARMIKHLDLIIRGARSVGDWPVPVIKRAGGYLSQESFAWNVVGLLRTCNPWDPREHNQAYICKLNALPEHKVCRFCGGIEASPDTPRLNSVLPARMHDTI